MAAKRGLGRGLESIFADNYSPVEKVVTATAKKDGIQTIRISEIEPKNDQPRKYFDTESLEALADSISQHGLLQPIIVREGEGGFYQILAGERRWRASKMAGLTEIPAIIMEADSLRAAEVAIIENVQRENLNPYEEAQAYASLMSEFNLTQEEVAAKVGKSRPAIANTMRLLELPEEVLELLKVGDISAGHARALLGLENEQDMIDLANKIIEKGLSVRDTENAVKRINEAAEEVEAEEEKINPQVKTHMKELERRAMSTLGRKVRISRSSRKKVVELTYDNDEDLEALLLSLCGEKIFAEIAE